MSEIKPLTPEERYKKIAESDWFKEIYDGKPFGDPNILIEDFVVALRAAEERAERAEAALRGSIAYAIDSLNERDRYRAALEDIAGFTLCLGAGCIHCGGEHPPSLEAQIAQEALSERESSE